MKVANDTSKTPKVKAVQAVSDLYDEASSCSAAEAELLYLLFEPQQIGDRNRVIHEQRSNMTLFVRRLVTTLSTFFG
ncbi:MAG: hypothetical protein HZB24_13025 [Desulfobacterales bacterium]|nr:hypothetical protein [Desulfomonile tiedjei]MBI5896875.1 hypothetical protein [Desulfobacterales bacterium]